MLKSIPGRLKLQPFYYLIRDFPLLIQLMIQGKIPALFTVIRVSISVMNQLLNLQTDHQTYWGRAVESVVYLLIKRPHYGKKLTIVYTLITSKLSVTHSLVGVLLTKECLIHSIILALLTNRLRMFLVRSVVKNEENCSNNLTRYSNKPLIITVTTVSAISVAVTVPSGTHLRPHYFTKHGHQFSDIQCTQFYPDRLTKCIFFKLPIINEL